MELGEIPAADFEHLMGIDRCRQLLAVSLEWHLMDNVVGVLIFSLRRESST
jgi:hypothetical protein